MPIRIPFRPQFPANRSGLLKYSTKMESVMWGRSYYLDVQGAGDVVTRPTECGQNGFCRIRPLSHVRNCQHWQKTKIRQSISKLTIPYYTGRFSLSLDPLHGFGQIDIFSSLSPRMLRHGSFAGPRSGFTQARASPFVGYWCTRAGHRPGMARLSWGKSQLFLGEIKL